MLRCACLYESVCICMHLHASVCICMHYKLLGFISSLRWKHCESPFSLASAVAVRHGLPAERQDSLYTSPVAALFQTLCLCREIRQRNPLREHLELQLQLEKPYRSVHCTRSVTSWHCCHALFLEHSKTLQLVEITQWKRNRENLQTGCL